MSRFRLFGMFVCLSAPFPVIFPSFSHAGEIDGKKCFRARLLCRNFAAMKVDNHHSREIQKLLNSKLKRLWNYRTLK